MTALLLSLIAGIIGADDAPADSAIDFAGRWYTQEEKSIVEIYDCGDGSPCGRVVWIDPDQENVFTDDHNKDPELRGRRLEGVMILSGYVRTDAGWKGGKLYNPENGKHYASKIELEADGTLLVKGCVGPICKGLRWTEAP
ncbi:DUF2147 domain-containing protein [Parvularcula marina]|uniref:DUF2147 domain-containing protein n=1 Tax=Parvularcula marina TaxID=2292771 RepID=UPI003515C831